MASLVLVRHGESRWNLADRFTGWVDVALSERGIEEAGRVAAHCKKFNYAAAFTSRLTRAQQTLLIILARQKRTGIFQHEPAHGFERWIRASNQLRNDDIPVYASHALNERFYGALQGMKKREVATQFGKEQAHAWRRGFHDAPPKGESLAHAYARMKPILIRHILPRVRNGQDVLVVAHGNTLRAAIKYLEHISDNDIAFIDLPDAAPLVYTSRGKHFVRTEGDYRFNRPLR
ncbi:MAG: hypothetical protein RL141_981 [Candidatus Parcubacteria bacterium]|jgi:2,3-bisphosphoglycerate-dependent phosphoglycerate mutase